MTDLNNIQKIYFIGIGGIGMSALARYFKFHGKEVSGYDKTESALTQQLTREGILVHYDDQLDNLNLEAQIVVYTPAIPKNNKLLEYYRQHNYPLLKRSDVLGLITQNSFNICVAGTHGKTTITTMVAHILRHSGYGCNAFLGGISVNYQSNFWSNERNVCVVEADEYDRSFLKLNPDIAVITAMDADHLDIYGTEREVQDAFIHFSEKIKPSGLLLYKKGIPRENELKAQRHLTYSLMDPTADAYSEKINMKDGSYAFNAVIKDWLLENTTLHMGGLHNIENIIAAITVAHLLGIADEKIKSAVAEFKGVKRRFEYILKDKGVIFIDDYAHHPAELKALISSAKSLFPDLPCTVIFQPHLFSRTKDFAPEFANSLDLSDETILLPIYPARELPIEGVNSKLIYDHMIHTNKHLMEKNEMLEWITNKSTGLFITAGAGDIDTLITPIKKTLLKNN